MFKRTVLALALAALFPLQASAMDNEDLLALVAMPLAVAAVSEVSDVPVSDLIDIVTLLNDANVPPVQFVEVIRYTPVALVVDNEPDFDDVLRAQIAQGVQGPALVPVIRQHFVDLGLTDIDLNVPRVVTVAGEPFVPEVVTSRIAAKKAHPHGGPPGQLKKVAGAQTGAEIVHASKRRSTVREDRVVAKHSGKAERKGHGSGKGKGKG